MSPLPHVWHAVELGKPKGAVSHPTVDVPAKNLTGSTHKHHCNAIKQLRVNHCLKGSWQATACMIRRYICLQQRCLELLQHACRHSSLNRAFTLGLYVLSTVLFSKPNRMEKSLLASIPDSVSCSNMRSRLHYGLSRITSSSLP